MKEEHRTENTAKATIRQEESKGRVEILHFSQLISSVASGNLLAETNFKIMGEKSPRMQSVNFMTKKAEDGSSSLKGRGGQWRVTSTASIISFDLEK